MNQPLLLQVPKQHDFSNPAVELSPKRLAAWLNELPLLNLSLSAKALLEALVPTNLQPMPAKTRIRLLELYRQTLVTVFDSLDEQALRGQPLSTQQRALARQHGAALYRELAIGYKLVVRELHGQDPNRQPFWHAALYRAMEATTLTLLDCFRGYQAPPTFAFLELHQLHVLAEQTGVLGTPPRLEKELLDQGSIDDLYRRLLMLSVADPYRLPAGAAVKLYRLLAPFAAQAVLRPYQETAPAGCYVVERGGDSAPVSCARAPSDYGLEQPLLLDLRPALQAIAQHLQQLRDGAQHDTESARLLALLVPQQPRQRQAPRRETQRQAWVGFGVGTVHHYLARGARAVAEAITEAQADIQVRDLEHEAEAMHELQRWQIVNESVSGYLLAGSANLQGQVQVGDAIAVVTPTRDAEQPRLSIAVVRWMRAGRNDTVEMGVELVPGNARAVICESQAGTGPALLLSSVPALRLPASVLAPRGTHAQGEVLRLRAGNRISAVRMGTILKQTECLEQFDFESAK